MYKKLQIKQRDDGKWIAIQPSSYGSMILHRNGTLRETYNYEIGFTFETAIECEAHVNRWVKLNAMNAILSAIAIDGYDEIVYDDILQILEKRELV